MASPTTTAADTNANDGAGNSNNHVHPEKLPPPRAPSRENRILKRVMSIPSIDEMGQVRISSLSPHAIVECTSSRQSPFASFQV